MDDSRSVQLSGALVPRAAMPSQSTNDVSFACGCCGGTDFRVETRRGTVKLRVYQAIVIGARSDHYDLYTCTRCDASVQRARDEVRDALIGELLFAAKHLAERQFTKARRRGRADLVCVECRMAQVDDNRLIHKRDCTVGSVVKLLHELVSLDDPEALRGLLDGGGGLPSFPAVANAQNGGVQ